MVCCVAAMAVMAGVAGAARAVLGVLGRRPTPDRDGVTFAPAAERQGPRAVGR